jgi:hypothetical protein
MLQLRSSRPRSAARISVADGRGGLAGLRRTGSFHIQAGAHQLRNEILELPLLLRRLDLDLGHQGVGQIDGRLHGPILPENQLSG